jgi:hypothetical protein
MTNKCTARTKSGEPCKAVPVCNGRCSLHSDPSRAAELGRKSGEARRFAISPAKAEPQLPPPRTATEVRNALSQAMSDVRARQLDPKVASTMAYLASVVLRSIEISDVHGRVAVLEEILRITPKRSKGVRR